MSLTLPVIGNVAAGTPMLAEQNVEDKLSLPTIVVQRFKYFYSSCSWWIYINAGIFDGDYIVKRAEAHDGANCRPYPLMTRQPLDYSIEKVVFVQPENDTMAPIYARTLEFWYCFDRSYSTPSYQDRFWTSELSHKESYWRSCWNFWYLAVRHYRWFYSFVYDLVCPGSMHYLWFTSPFIDIWRAGISWSFLFIAGSTTLHSQRTP